MIYDMEKLTTVILSNMCMVYDHDMILVCNRTKSDWPGLTFPGGHVEENETLEEAVIREIKEETNLDIKDVELVGIKEWFMYENVRYIGLLYRTNKYQGELKSSSEGEVFWINKKDLHKYELSQDFEEMCNNYFFKK